MIAATARPPAYLPPHCAGARALRAGLRDPCASQLHFGAVSGQIGPSPACRGRPSSAALSRALLPPTCTRHGRSCNPVWSAAGMLGVVRFYLQTADAVLERLSQWLGRCLKQRSFPTGFRPQVQLRSAAPG